MASSPEQRKDYKFAELVKKKSLLVGAVTLFLAPPIALFEAAQWGVANWYENRLKKPSAHSQHDFYTQKG